ncbi:MAG: peptidylprolyl isomerase [Candidatus Omnitrophica bacterium]|nr:peptidylprolyl isomerase [Candidatus Omnitrophota bacterium]
MKKAIGIFLIFFTGISIAQAAPEELLDRVVAVVNDEVITQAELDAFLRPLYEDYSQQYTGDELASMVQDARQKLLNQLIEDKLVYQEAVKQQIMVTESDLDKEVQKFKQQLERPDELELILEREGMTLKDLREKLRKQAMVRELHDREIRSRVIVSPLEIENFYKENPEKFVIKDRVKVRSLTIKKSQDARDKGIPDERAKMRIAELQRKLFEGQDFERMVQGASEDGRAKQGGLGEWIDRGGMIESVDEAVFKTPIGELTGIVETPIGYHIFRVEDKESSRTRTLEETREQIAGYLFQQKSNERFQEWMQSLKRTAYISIR